MDTITNALEFSGLSKRYGKTEAVSSLQLRVRAGTNFGLVGANGAGKDFLKYMAGLYGRNFDLAACNATLASLALDSDVLTKPVRTLSKGMTHKRGIAGCLLSGRELLVLDEPSSGLDPKARALFESALQSARSRCRTIFPTSHALADIDGICDEMAVLHRGSLLFTGTPTALKQRHGADNLEQAYLGCIGQS